MSLRVVTPVDCGYCGQPAEVIDMGNDGGFYVQCTCKSHDCFCGPVLSDSKKAIKAWNKIMLSARNWRTSAILRREAYANKIKMLEISEQKRS